jgi:hypothetical protein
VLGRLFFARTGAGAATAIGFVASRSAALGPRGEPVEGVAFVGGRLR